jgi:NADH dehydrogenase [ubiquinone] 1 alpha subcomplex assembly factor 7
VTALRDRIAALVAAQGPISLAEFMGLANGAYYAARDPLGTAGDFTTAPEISQMFGELLGLWCVQAWADQGQAVSKRLVELGPGRGSLMADALRAMEAAPAFRADLDIVLVEASPVLEALQRRHVPAARWAAQFDARPADRPLFLLANEFFDALPVRQFVKTKSGWHERMVGVDGEALSFLLSPVAVPLLPADAPQGAVREICPAAEAIVEEIARAIAAKGGAALIVDYGYDRAGFGETLQAVRAHAFARVLEAPGDADLSAHVDFSALRAAAERGGAKPYGPVPQGAFLEALGIRARAARLAALNPASSESVRAALARLTDSDQMGTLFKALAIVPCGAPRPPGFETC